MSAEKWIFVLPWDFNYPGGVNQVVINLMSVLEDNAGMTSRLLIDSSEQPVSLLPNVAHVTLSNPLWSPGVLGVVKYLLKLPKIFATLNKIIGKDACCINPHYPTLNVLNYVLYREMGFYKGKVILSFHGMDLRTIHKAKGLEKTLWLFIFSHVDALVFCSNALADEFCKDINSETILKKIKVIVNGIDPEKLENESKQAMALPIELRNQRYVLNVATFEHKKGQDILIRAFARIRAKYDLKLCLIGRSTPVLEELQGLANHLGCGDEVMFYSDLPHQDVLNFFKQASVFCLPSRYEPFGLVLLEAGYFGCPIVAAKVGGIPEIITDNKNGQLFKADDEDGLVFALDTALSRSNDALQRAETFREDVLSKFSWRTAAQRYKDLVISGSI